MRTKSNILAEISEEFDLWYKEQHEMNPYIMRDYFLTTLSRAFDEILESVNIEPLKDITRNPKPQTLFGEGFNEACRMVNEKIKVIKQ